MHHTNATIARIVFRLLLSLVLLVPMAAEDAGTTDTDEESLFGEPLISEIEETDTEISSMLLTSDEVRIGGRYSMSLSAGYGWNEIPRDADDLFHPDTDSVSTGLSTQIYLDARPDEGFRMLGKTTVSYPFETTTGRDLADVIHVDELFADFQWRNTMFFRAGKQELNWGTGFFYRPADLLSIARVDPEDPDADVEGPIALKAGIPIGTSSIYLYVLPEYAQAPLDIGVAAKAEVLVGGTEITAGIVYQREVAPAAMLTASSAIGDFDLFAEGVAGYGSDRTFVREASTPLGLESYSVDDDFFFTATAGTSWSSTLETCDTTLSFTAQYLYNGEGYEEPEMISGNQMAIGSLLASGELTTGDLSQTGRHYTAARIGLFNLLDADVSASVFWMQNYSDRSARVIPSITATMFDLVDLSISTPFAIGDAGDEFAPAGNTITLEIGASLTEAF